MKGKTKTATIILMLFKFVNSNGFLLHGSAGPLTARLGGAVLLPCFVDRPLPLVELEVDWRRTDSGTIVHLFLDGQSRPESQGDAYRGRTHFFTQEIPKGNFSLLLEGVRTADAGVYKCVVYKVQERHETRVEIQEVEWLVVTGADEPVYAHAGEDVTLNCSVDTHVNVTELQVKWIKTDDDGDILVLLYADGENRPESQDGRYSGRAEFFTEEIPKGNFSMKLRKVRTEDKGEFRCEVHSDTDSASTTARIAALGYSSLHWLILGLCIAVIHVVVLTAALSVWHLGGNRRHARVYHSLHVPDRKIIVSSILILWGVIEGSKRDAATCTVVSLLIIPLLFIMASFVVSTGNWRHTRVYYSTDVADLQIMVSSALILWGVIERSKRDAATCDDISLLIIPLLFIMAICVDSTGNRRHARVYHSSDVTDLQITVSSALILWGVIERFKGDAATCDVISLLIIPLLFIMAICVDSTAKLRKYVYFSGAFDLPLLNSVALAAVLILTADTVKQSLDLWLIVLISWSVFLFSWLVKEIFACYLPKTEKIKEQLNLALGLVERHQDPDLDQRSCDNWEMEALSPADPIELNTEEGPHDNEETVALSPTDPNGPNTEEVAQDE